MQAEHSTDGRTPVISMIVPVYNTERFLGVCLDSLLAQDVPQEAYEIVCVDDGSADGSGALLEDYSARSGCVSVYRQANAGVSTARNRGLDAARGEYVWFIDSDDFIKKNVLSAIISVLRGTECDCLSVLPFVFKDTEGAPAADPAGLTDVSRSKHRTFLPTKIIKRSIIEEHQIRFAADVTYFEDHLFFQQVLSYVKTQETLEEKVYFYRLHAGSASSQELAKRIGSHLNIARRCRELLRTSEGERLDNIRCFLYTNVAFAMQSIAGLPAKKRKEYLRMAKDFGVFPLKYSKRYTGSSVRPNQSFSKKIARWIQDHAYLRSFYGFLVLLHKTGLFRE